MPKVSVYLPDELYRQVRERGLSVSALSQAAIKAELERRPNAAWLAEVSSRPRRCHEVIDTSALLAEVRDEFAT